MNSKRKYQQVPVELAEYVFHNKLVEPFQVYFYLKCCKDGIVNKSSPEFKNMSKALDFRSHNTVNKYLSKAIQLNWIGFDAKSQNLYIRSIHHLRAKYKMEKRHSVLFNLDDIKRMRFFLASIILSVAIKNQKLYFEIGPIGRLKTAAKKTGVALQVEASPGSKKVWLPSRYINDLAGLNKRNYKNDRPAYFGYCNQSIGRILRCSKTTANELKQGMEKSGFIETVKHTRVLGILQKRDYCYRQNLYKAYPELIGKVLFKVREIHGRNSVKPKRLIEVYLQLHDEIKPKIRIKRVASQPTWFVKQKAA